MWLFGSIDGGKFQTRGAAIGFALHGGRDQRFMLEIEAFAVERQDVGGGGVDEGANCAVTNKRKKIVIEASFTTSR